VVVTQEINKYSDLKSYKLLESGLYYTPTANKRHLRLIVIEKGGPFLMVNNFNQNEKKGSIMWLVNEELENSKKDLALNWLKATGEKIVIEG